MNHSEPYRLPWQPGTVPLMLAPLQGLTNSAMRKMVIERARPDVVFTEFLRVSAVSKKRFGRRDMADIVPQQDGVPLIVQLVGHGVEPLVAAAQIAQDAGAMHLNLNLGCPYGRMTTAATGGALLQHPERLAELLGALRKAIIGGFSVKLRAGYADPRQIFSLLPMLEDCGIDWLTLHPRTVEQKYSGCADHLLTAEVVSRTRLPVIANGDIRNSIQGRQLLAETGATGLMIGRAAMADPLIFKRLRGEAADAPGIREQADELRDYLLGLLPLYQQRFCGEKQALDKLKNVLLFIEEPAFASSMRQLKKCRTIPDFVELINALPG